MKALVYEGPWQMPVHDVPAPQPRRGEVVVAIRASGICGSDVHGFVGSTGRRRAGIVMGHEAAGEVSAVGPGVDGLRAGDRVALRSSLACGECDECRAGRSNACSKRLGLGTDFDGAYAEAVAVPAALAVPLPDGVSYEQAAVIEPLAVALHAVELTPFGPDDDVAIIGAGAIGLLALLAVRDRGAARIVVTDRSRHRLALAHRFGADVTIEAQKGDPAAAIREATDGEGAAALIEAVGIAPTVEQSLAAARTGAHVTWVGNAALTVQVPMQDVVTRELTIHGAHGSSVEFDQAARLIASGRVDVRPLIERVAPLEDGPSIFRALGEGRLDAAKVILEPAPRRAAARARGSAATAGPA